MNSLWIKHGLRALFVAAARPVHSFAGTIGITPRPDEPRHDRTELIPVNAADSGPHIGGEFTDCLDDLERRAEEALNKVPHVTSRAEAEGVSRLLPGQLETSLGLSRAPESSALTALVYSPARLEEPAPAILLVFPHDDPRRGQCQAFAVTLAHLGFIVLTFDYRGDFNLVDLIPHGLSPAGVAQAEIRAGLKYLASRSEVDHRRIGLIGSGLTATVAAVLNPQFSAVALVDGAPDMEDLLRQMRNLRDAELPDWANLIPGLFSYADTEGLFTGIAPRPLLIVNAEQKQSEYVTDLYRAYDAADRLTARGILPPVLHGRPPVSGLLAG